MGKFQIDFLDLQEKDIFDAGTLAFVQNQLRLLFANTFKRADSESLAVVVTDDKVTSRDGMTEPKLAVEYSGEPPLQTRQVYLAARMIAFLALMWRHGLPITPYVIEMD